MFFWANGAALVIDNVGAIACGDCPCGDDLGCPCLPPSNVGWNVEPNEQGGQITGQTKSDSNGCGGTVIVKFYRDGTLVQTVTQPDVDGTNIVDVEDNNAPPSPASVDYHATIEIDCGGPISTPTVTVNY